MALRLNNKLIWAGGTGIALALAFVLWYRQADAPPLAGVAAPAKRSWEGPIGPGALRSSASASASLDEVDFEEVPEGVARVDERGHLITDVQLHNAMDSYLLHTDVPSRQAAADKLRAYFKRKLPAMAESEADELVTRYLAYMDTHDAALARMRFAPAGADGLSEMGVDQFAAWLEQRRGLRQAMLGATVYKEWFAAEDARCAGLLAAMRAQGAGARDTVLAHDALDCSTEMGRSFVQIETEERQWTRHYARYREALGRLEENDPARRALQLAALRQQIFSNDAERERAQALGSQ
jgi:lipase chaperone LimK